MFRSGALALLNSSRLDESVFTKHPKTCAFEILKQTVRICGGQELERFLSPAAEVQLSFRPPPRSPVGFAGDGGARRRPFDIQERSCLARRWRGAAALGLKGARL